MRKALLAFLVLCALPVVAIPLGALGMLSLLGGAAQPAGGGGVSAIPLAGDLAGLALQLGVPARALEGVVLVDRASLDRVGCRAPWWLLLSVSVEESAAGTHGGASIGADWVVRPSIGGPVLAPGSGFEVIDVGGSYDYARGPFQFISSSWWAMGEDYDGDGVADPDNWLDAALGAANHLCLSAGGRGSVLAEQATALRGLYGYNADHAYGTRIWARAMDYLIQGGDTPAQGQAANVAPSGAPTGTLVDLPSDLCEGGACQLDASWAPNAIAALRQAAVDGYPVVTISTNRTYEQQAGLYACYQAGRCGIAAAPGTSNHEGGQAMDLARRGGASLAGPGDPYWEEMKRIGPQFGVLQQAFMAAVDTPHFSVTGN